MSRKAKIDIIPTCAFGPSLLGGMALICLSHGWYAAAILLGVLGVVLFTKGIRQVMKGLP